MSLIQLIQHIIHFPLEMSRIDITYEVKDFDDLTDENNFSITVSGTNDAPTASFNDTQYATENASEAGFTSTDGGVTYSVDLTGRFATGQQEVYTFKSAKLSFFDMTDPANNTETDVDAIGNVAGLTISQTGALQFNAGDAIYTGLGATESRQIQAIYDVTSGGTTASNEFTIDIASDGSSKSVDFNPTRILGQLTASDVDRKTTLTYELVGAPLMTINGETGAWELDASAPAYQELTTGNKDGYCDLCGA